MSGAGSELLMDSLNFGSKKRRACYRRQWCASVEGVIEKVE